MRLDGHVRSEKSLAKGLKGTYFEAGLEIMDTPVGQKVKPFRRHLNHKNT